MCKGRSYWSDALRCVLYPHTPPTPRRRNRPAPLLQIVRCGGAESPVGVAFSCLGLGIHIGMLASWTGALEPAAPGTAGCTGPLNGCCLLLLRFLLPVPRRARPTRIFGPSADAPPPPPPLLQWRW